MHIIINAVKCETEAADTVRAALPLGRRITVSVRMIVVNKTPPIPIA